jgi:hypothetical protein
MFGLIGEVIIFGAIFSNHTLSVALADMMHSQYTITSHLISKQETLVSFGNQFLAGPSF